MNWGWSVISIIISSIISYFIAKHVLKKNLRSSLYIDELKEIKEILKYSLESVAASHPTLMNRGSAGFHYDNSEYRNKIQNLSLSDVELMNLLNEYLKNVDEYNSIYFDYHKKHRSGDVYSEDTISEEGLDGLLSEKKQKLKDLYLKINIRIEKIIT